jgi:WD40 repeat protein
MNESLRQKLCDIVAAHGSAVADDPRRCGELLRQAAPEDGAGVEALLRALEARVPARLALLTEPLALAPLTSGLVRRLVDEQGLSEEQARWAVESWAVALGKGNDEPAALPGGLPAYEHVLAPPPRRWRFLWYALPVLAVAAAVGGWWWNQQRSEVRRLSGRTSGINCLALSADGHTVLVGCGDKSLRLWDVDTGAELGKFDGHEGPPSSVAPSPDGRLALSCGGQVQSQNGKISATDCVVRAWDLGRGQASPPFGIGFKITDNVLKKLGEDGMSEAVRRKLGPLKDRRFDSEQDLTNELAKLLTRDAVSWRWPFPASWVSWLNRRAKVLARDEVSRHQKAMLEYARAEGYDVPIYHVTFSPDGKLALACMGGWEYKENEYLFNKEKQPLPKDCVVRLYDVATGQQVRKLEGHKMPVWSAAFTPDGKHVVSAGWDSTLRLWEVATGRELGKVDVPDKGHVLCLAVSPDGKRLLTGDDQSRVALWNLDDLELEYEQKRSTQGVWGVAFSPDGRRAVSGGDDFQVRLWDADTLTELRHFPGHTSSVRGVAFLPDGRHALSASGDGTVRVWRMP